MSTLIGLFVILLCFAVGGLMRFLRKDHRPLQREKKPMAPPRPPFSTFIDPAHSWARIMSDGTFRIGIDDFLAEAIGPLDRIEFPPPGTRVSRGDPLFHVHFGDKRLAVVAPIAGEVVAINTLAESSPLTVSCDPYGLGWTVAMRTRDHKEAINPLFVGNGALAFLRRELAALADFFVERATPGGATTIMADGGLPAMGAVADLGREDLESFAARFLRQ